MTDGIIQEVIKPLLDFYLSHEEEFYYESNDVAMTIQKLQQELIEKIKAEFPDVDITKSKQRNAWLNNEIIKKLIGDNEK